MKNYFIKLLITTFSVIVIAHFLKIDITDYNAALFLAITLSLLNTFLKPILILLTIPVTIFTLGLFLLVINAIILKIADHFIDGIYLHSFAITFIFSIILSLLQAVLNKLFVTKK